MICESAYNTPFVKREWCGFFMNHTLSTGRESCFLRKTRENGIKNQRHNDYNIHALRGRMSTVARLYTNVPTLRRECVCSDCVAGRLVALKYGDSSGVRETG